MASLYIQNWYRSGIGKRTGFQETDQKMATYICNNCNESFEFENLVKFQTPDFQVCECGGYAFEQAVA